ncbi:hypothetical protein B0H21DRAFT_895216 [Amylocystis lapponica]|nr:hypothetical protein B0H21DRAFT_895216 [Amylocystis lapponica]
MASEGHRHDSTASASSFAKSYSLRSSRAPPSTVKTVITAPPWARDEPPSPTERDLHPTTSSDSVRHLADPHFFDVASYESSLVEDPGPSRWWTFARHRPTGSYFDPRPGSAPSPLVPKSPRAWDRSLSIPWLSVPHYRRSLEESSGAVRGKEGEGLQGRGSRHSPAEHLWIDIPPPPTAPITLSQNYTPGWETPWAARPPSDLSRSVISRDGITELPESLHQDQDEKLGPWTRRHKRFRAYMLYNAYVPVLFRFVNVALTTAALAMAIRIRSIEKRNGIMGAVGSSPTLVIIFAPLTLVHVMLAIYVEYFGRPLGLWRTSSKLAYTLIEVIFVCAWSAALALTFDNFFTSLIPCASAESTAWYSQLPRQSIGSLNDMEGTVGDSVCDHQLALICLVGIGLIMYCFNLIISLFRIFERVKYHPTSVLPA